MQGLVFKRIAGIERAVVTIYEELATFPSGHQFPYQQKSHSTQ